MSQRTTSEILDRMPPSDLEAEKNLVGACLLHPAVIDDVALLVRPEQFYSLAVSKMFRHILDIRDNKGTVDTTMLVNRLKEAGEFEAIGGNATIFDALHSVPHPRNATTYAEIIVEKARRREIIHVCTEALRDAYEDRTNAEDLAAKAEAELSRIQTIGTKYRPATATESAIRAMQKIAAIKERDDRWVSFTGIQALDGMIGGLFGGELTILAACASVGKTSLGMQVAYHNAQRGRLTLVTSMEMPSEDLTIRTLCGIGGVSTQKIRCGSTTSDDDKRLVEAAAQYSQAALRIDDTPGNTAQGIRRWARTFAKDNLRLICVDYLGLIEPEDHKVSREQQVSTNARRMKNLARELNVPIICLCQFNRQADPFERPKLAFLRESGAIEQHADSVWFLYKHKPTKDEWYNCVLEVAKQRNGETGSLYMRWEPTETKLYDRPKYETYSEFDQYAGNDLAF